MSARAEIAAVFLLMVANAHAAPAPAPSPRAQLKESTEQLQKTPDDAALREKIIALVRKVKPAPTVSEEARRHFVVAGTMQKKAKSPKDYAEAIAEYDAALLIAPWWADAYYNLSVVDEAAGRLDAARDALKLFLATKPKDADARQAQDRIYALEAQEKLQASDDSARAAESAARETAAREKFVDSILGHWRTNGYSVDVARGSSGDVEITCRWNSSSGWQSPGGEGINAISERLLFKCTDADAFTREFNFAFDDKGRLIGTITTFLKGEPLKWGDGRIVQPETAAWSR